MDESEHKPSSFAVLADFPKFFRQMSPDGWNHENTKAMKRRRKNGANVRENAQQGAATRENRKSLTRGTRWFSSSTRPEGVLCV